MAKGIKGIFKGNQDFEENSLSGYQHQLYKISEVWRGDKYDDFGILRIFRLTLVTMLLLFPGVLIDEIFKSWGTLSRKLVVEFYVLIKTIFPALILAFRWYDYTYIYLIAVYFLIETYIYLFSKIFLEYQHLKGSNTRTLLMLVLNFFESGLTFAVIYIAGDFLNIPIESAIDAIYFSFITSSTVGYGDIHPISDVGKILSIVQIFSSISFLVLFFNFFSGKSSATG
ncbi:MAG: potassium channel family protein [Bacteroidetes bacterium]|nr:potassium channel family protein [Bacteroidota bacterium]MBU1484643.1 potassium channel family protein [Bacteroidota bacterium]MBU2377395.1 potassium channel family protein [Bacteroidota bacterium]